MNNSHAMRCNAIVGLSARHSQAIAISPWLCLRWLLLAWVVGLAACGGGGSGDVGPNTPPAVTTGTVTGVVLASGSGALLSGVAVTAGARSTTTDSNGQFTLTEVVAANPAVLKFDLAGYVRGVATVPLAAGSTATAGVRLTPVALKQSFDATTAAVLNVANSTAQVSLPAGGLVNATSGAAASGNVTAEVTPIDPAANPANMPGGYRATSANGNATTIESFGALSVVLRDAAGNTLNLASAQTAKLRIPLSSRAATPPTSIPLFYFNETTGLWVEQGTATLQGTAPNQYYEGTVSHFTVWNADRATETLQVGGCLQDDQGQPVVGAEVVTEGANYSGSDTARTDAKGNFTLGMMRGSGVANVYARSGSLLSNIVRAGPSDSNITLPQCLRTSKAPVVPVFLAQPANTIAAVTGCAYFSAQAVGSEPMKYQWQRNGVAIANATGTILPVCNVVAGDDQAKFTLVASNMAGSATSGAATLSVVLPAPPQILTHPQPQLVQLGATATFQVAAVAFSGTLSYQWQRNGQAINGATSINYTTPPTTAADDGARFSVVVSSSDGGSVTSSAALLTVSSSVAPTITQQPKDQAVVVGQGATFSVVASGLPAPTYQWRRNSAAIAGATAASYSLPSTVLADSGALFSVVVSNSKGQVTSTDAKLTVTQATTGAGYYLLGSAGPVTDVDMVYANGTQSLPTQALLAVREDAPSSGAVTVETSGGSGIFSFGAFEATISGDQVTNARSRLAVYTKGGRFYKVDQVVTLGAPTPVLLSSLTSAEVCGSSGAPEVPSFVDGGDWADASRGWLFIRAPGPDAQCGTPDDTYRALRLNMGAATAALTIGEPIAQIHAANGAFAGLVVRNGSQMQLLNADLNSPTNLFQVDPVTFVNAGNVFAGGLPGLWLFVDGRTLYGVNLAVPATRVALATLATGETVMNHLAADGSAVYVAINAAATSRVLRVPPTLVASNVSSFDAPAVDLTLTTTRVVARLSSTPARIVTAPKTGGSMLTIHTAAVGDTLLALLGSGENVYASKLSVSASSFGYSSLIVGADGSNMQTLANTSLMRGVGPNPLLISQGLSQVYAVLLVDGLSTEGSYAGATLRAVEGATRNTLTTFGNFAPGGVASAFIFGLAPMQYGKTGLISLLAAGANANIATGDLYFFKSDSAGLVRVTTFVPANAAPAGAVQTPSPQSLVRAAARRGLR